MGQGAHRHTSNGGTHAPMWCADCDRPHDGTRDDVRTLLGTRGVIMGRAYARCTTPNGCGVLHTMRLDARLTTRIPTHGRVRLHHTDDTTQDGANASVRGSRATTTDTLALEVGTRAARYAVNVQAQRFADAFAAQRTRGAFM